MNPVAADYFFEVSKIIDQVSEYNPNLQQVVGTAIFPFVEKITGWAGRAPKITGALIVLPID